MPVRAIASISLIYVTRMLGLFMVLPVLMLLGQDYTGATATTLGLALGIYGLTQAGLQIPLGMLSDLWGRRPVLVAGLLLFILGSVVAALAESVQWLIVGRALQGAGAISSTLMALLSDLTPPQHRTRAMMVVGISIGLSFSLAMVLGPLVAEVWGLSGIFVFTAGLALASMVLVFTLPEPQRLSNNGYQSWQAAEMLGVLQQPALWTLNIGVFCLHAVLAAMFLLLPLRLSALDFSLGQQGLIYLAMAAVALVALGPMMGQSERRHRPKAMLLLAQVLLIIALISLPFIDGWLMTTLVVMALFFIGFNFLEASLPSWLSRLAPPRQRGTAMGVFSTAQFLGAAAGGGLGGLALDTGGVSLLIGCALLFVSIWFILTAIAAPPPLTRALILSAHELTGGRAQLAAWADRLSELDGVLDVHVSTQDDALVLRVSSVEFDPATLDVARKQKPTD